MLKSVRKIAATCLAISMGLWSVAAYAVWSESVQIVGEQSLPEGASATLTLDSGLVIEGEVEERDGQKFLVFILPGSSSQPGTIEITTGTTVRSYRHASHGGNSGTGLDLSESGTRPLAGTSSDNFNNAADQLVREGFRFTLGISGAHWMSDFFAERIDRNTADLIPILDNVFGGTNSSARGSVDDSGCAYGVDVGAKLTLANGGELSATLGYADFSAADGSIVGFTDVGGNDVEVRAFGESELDAYTLRLGYSHLFGRQLDWRWYVAAGWMRFGMEDSSTTLTFVNGDEVDRFSSSDSDDDMAEFLEFGISYDLGRMFNLGPDHGLNLGLGYQTTTETFNGENMTAAKVRLSVDF